MTGIGGFLQEFLYGYSGMRWNPDSVGLSPSLTSQIGGIVLHDVQWRGRTFRVAIGPQRTTVTLDRRAGVAGHHAEGPAHGAPRPRPGAAHAPARSDPHAR